MYSFICEFLSVGNLHRQQLIKRGAKFIFMSTVTNTFLVSYRPEGGSITNMNASCR